MELFGGDFLVITSWDGIRGPVNISAFYRIIFQVMRTGADSSQKGQSECRQFAIAMQKMRDSFKVDIEQ